MEKQSYSNIDILIFGTLGMLILVLGLIIFVLLHRKKLNEKKIQIDLVQKSYQSQLIKSVVLAKEKEQERISKELHDDVGSILTAIKINMNSLDLKSESKDQINQDLKDVVVRIREICNELYPSVLMELGLCDALRNLCRNLLAKSNLNIEYKCLGHELNKIDKDTELAFYRIIQESLSNIVKYSGCSKVSLNFIHLPTYVQVEIVDDGVNFKRSEQEIEPGHFGLKNIESRLEQIEAELEEDESYLNGNRITITKYYG